MSAIIVMMGFMGMATVFRNNALNAEKMFNRFFFTFMVYAVFFVYAKKSDRDFRFGLKHYMNIEVALPEPTPEVEDDGGWPAVEPFGFAWFFFWMGSIYLCSLIKFIEKSYAELTLFKYAKTLVVYPSKKDCENTQPQMVYMPVNQNVKVENVEVFNYAIE